MPEFYNFHTANVMATVEKETLGGHGMILGIPFLCDLGLSVDFKNKAIKWDKLIISMQTKNEVRTCPELLPRNIQANNPIQGTDSDGVDKDLPASVRKAAASVNSGLSANLYNKHDYKK